MKKRTKIVIGLIVALHFCFLGLLVYGIFGGIRITINGGEKVTSTIYNSYNDLGISVSKFGYVLNNDWYSYDEVNNIDISKIGKYTESYDVNFLLRNFHVERTVEVIDDIKPTIITNLSTIKRDFCSKKDQEKLEYEALDNYDGDLTDKVTLEEDDDTMFIRVMDSHDNLLEMTLPIEYTDKPEDIFRINGSSTTYVSSGSKYSDSGVTYTDGCGNPKEGLVKTGNVDTSKTGEYTINYAADGKTLTRKVIVYNANAGSYIPSGEKVIYLTFDDGPGVYTERILNTLAKYNVKATFFVTHQFGNYVHLIKREYEEGHSVAVHSYTHNWNIYYSVDNYVNDFNKMNDDIEYYTGTRSKIFRFPGGSSNTISRGYSKGVVSAIASKMNSDGYVYFDWDVNSGDAEGANQSTVYSKVTSGAGWCNKCVILMHDIKYATANALDDILNTLTSKGYKFGTLSTASPTVHHTIAN